MGNCLRLGISRIGLAWSKWRMAAKFKRKTISIIILGMQAVGKSTIALRLYKFKRALPDLNYVQTKGFNTYTMKRKKTTINIYDLGGHLSIQELWDHYYADAHGVIFVVDTSQRDSMPAAGQLLSTVLNDARIRGKPVLLLANKIDLEEVPESEVDALLNLQQLVNSVRCLTRLDVSCATDLKNDKGIFEGFKWLISHIESNYLELNTRVLSDVMEEKNREKARKEAIKAARLLEKEVAAVGDEENPPLPSSKTTSRQSSISQSANLSHPLGPNGPITLPTPEVNPLYDREAMIPPPNGSSKPSTPPQPLEPQLNGGGDATSPASRPNSQTQCKNPPPEKPPRCKSSSTTRKTDHTLPPLPNSHNPFLVEQPVKLPRLKSPKSRPEIINRIEDHDDEGLLNESGPGGGRGFLHRNGFPVGVNVVSSNDQYYEQKGFRFRRISAARRPSPEGADSDDGIVNLAYEPNNEDISSDDTPVGVRKHNFAAHGSTDSDVVAHREILMVTTLAEVHKEYFKDRKGSTSTHDSISMSVASVMSDDSQATIPQDAPDEKASGDVKKPSNGKEKSKKRFNFRSKNKTVPSEQMKGGSNRQTNSDTAKTDNNASLSLHGSRTSSATSKRSGVTFVPNKDAVATVAHAWGKEESLELNKYPVATTPVVPVVDEGPQRESVLERY